MLVLIWSFKMGIREELIKELARKSYIDYVEYVHEGRWLRGKHLEYVCKAVEKVISGEIKRLIISMPPQHGKISVYNRNFA